MGETRDLEAEVRDAARVLVSLTQDVPGGGTTHQQLKADAEAAGEEPEIADEDGAMKKAMGTLEEGRAELGDRVVDKVIERVTQELIAEAEARNPNAED